MATGISDDPLVFGTALRTQRTAVGLTLADVAAQVGVTAGQLSRIETGKSRPSFTTLMRLRDALGLSVGDGNLPVARPTPDDTLAARLGALLAVRHSLALGEASRLLTTSVAAVRAAAAGLTGHLVAAGMVVVDDCMTVTLLPHRDFVGLADTALTADRIPRLREPHLEVLGFVLNAGRATRRRIDEMRGVDSAETIAHLVEWGLLQREGAEGRSPIYCSTATAAPPGSSR